jgi:hypothetical protein
VVHPAESTIDEDLLDEGGRLPLTARCTTRWCWLEWLGTAPTCSRIP